MGAYFSLPILMPGCSRVSTTFCSILVRIVSVRMLKIYYTFVPFFADVYKNGILRYFANLRPSSKAILRLE